MTINNELFTRRPLDFEIPNDGVTNVDRPDDSNQWKVLEYDSPASSARASMNTALSASLVLTSATAAARFSLPSGSPASTEAASPTWCGSFSTYGQTRRFPNGASARGLVNLLKGSRPAHRTLDHRQAGRRPPWSAAGALDRSGDTLNAVFLAIVLGAAGLPSRVEPAQVALWLAGKARPGRRPDPRRGGRRGLHRGTQRVQPQHSACRRHPGCRSQFRCQRGGCSEGSCAASSHPNRALVTDETIALLRKVLQHVGGGAIPPTLIVLDEVQQYINGGDGRAMEVQNLVESVSRELEGRVLLVATGQQELTADATLQKIQDRFTVKVVLKNQDVDAVVRRVLLNKEPADRLNTRAGARGCRRRDLPSTRRQQDSAHGAGRRRPCRGLPAASEPPPLLGERPAPGRRWPCGTTALAASDRARRQPTGCQQAVGTVVGADYLYSAKHEDLNGAGLLLKETQRLIHEQGQKEPLRGRVLGLIHLISLLPTPPPGDIGVRATVDHLVDLLVEDLANDGTALRQEVPVGAGRADRRGCPPAGR